MCSADAVCPHPSHVNVILFCMVSKNLERPGGSPTAHLECSVRPVREQIARTVLLHWQLKTQKETGVSEGIFARRHHFNSWLISVISIPGITMNLQLSISCGSSSSGS